MGEGRGEGEYNAIPRTYVPLPLIPSRLLQQVGEGKMEESYYSPPARGGET